MSSINNALGGYFELELPTARPQIYPEAHRYQSARAAFYALLLAGRPRKVWMPHYICDSMLAPLTKAGIDTYFYSINEDFSLKDDIDLSLGEWFFYVNYFGICANQQLEILKKFNPKQVIFDHSQAFFSRPLDCLATLYSPRKFFGIPDGGLLITELKIHEPETVDDESIQRSLHLLKRLAGAPEAGYSDYQKAEKTLEDFHPKRISALTEKILSTIDYEFARSKRSENFFILHEELGHYNRLDFDLKSIDGPLCYPLLNNRESLSSDLAKERIFTPTYWPECRTRTPKTSTEHILSDQLVSTPCDQRYCSKDLISAIKTIKRNLSHE